MTILQNAIHVGTESTYGTGVTPTRSFEGKADQFKTDRQFIDSVGFRQGMQTNRSDRRTIVNMGGTGSLEVDVLTKGMGMLFAGALGSTNGPTQVASTIAYLSTFTSNANGPATSYTIQTARADIAGTKRIFTHEGCVITNWTLGTEVGGLLVFSADYDFEDVNTATSEAVAAYPATTLPYDWTQCSVSIGGSPVTDVSSFEFSANLGMKTDRRYLRGSALKKQPVRNAVPEYTGQLQADFTDLTRYAEFVAGTVLALEVTWTGAQIVSGQNYEVKLTLPAVQWTGESPEVSLDDTPKQPLPFKVLDSGSGAAVTLTYKSVDTTL